MIARWMRQLGRLLIVLGCLLVVLYVGDFLVLEYHAAHGTGYSTVEVTQFLATKLKGNKTEYDMMGTSEETCTRTLFPQKGYPPCWWLQKHTSQWE